MKLSLGCGFHPPSNLNNPVDAVLSPLIDARNMPLAFLTTNEHATSQLSGLEAQ